jgi:4-hydroxy-2-oxoheptanedioate aldolase
MTRPPSLGCFCALGSPVVAEIVARTGSFGWLCLDLQHGMGGFAECVACLQAISGTGLPVLVRSPAGANALVTRALDAGADGVLIANVETPEQARHAGMAAYYPPRGQRSIGPTRARFLHEDYVSSANDRIECAVMLESPRAFASLRDIAAEPISGIFAGLADLQLALGQPPGNPLGDPRTRRWLDDLLAVCRHRGLKSGAFSEDPATAAELGRMGFDRVAVALDASLLLTGARGSRAAFDTAWAAL